MHIIFCRTLYERDWKSDERYFPLYSTVNLILKMSLTCLDYKRIKRGEFYLCNSNPDPGFLRGRIRILSILPWIHSPDQHATFESNSKKEKNISISLEYVFEICISECGSPWFWTWTGWGGPGGRPATSPRPSTGRPPEPSTIPSPSNKRQSPIFTPAEHSVMQFLLKYSTLWSFFWYFTP